MKNVISVLRFGLCNVLFEIACAASYAKYHGYDLYFTVEDKKRLEFNRFLKFFKPLRFKPKPGTIMRIGSEYKCSFKNFKPCPDDKDNILMTGLYQGEKYFDQALIKELFKPTVEEKQKIKELYGDISECVSIHVRRKDYLLKELRGFFTIPEPEWYEYSYHKYFEGKKAIIVSDDIDWCKRNIKIDGAVYADSRRFTGSQFLDLFTCAECKHHIISCSTFSWWGAFLGEKKDSIVVSPDVWFGPNVVKEDLEIDIIPNRWIKEKA